MNMIQKNEEENKEWTVRRNRVIPIANVKLKLEKLQRWITVTSDSSKVYCSIVFGMMGEGVLEVGYSSVNGSAGENTHPDCIAAMVEAANNFVASNTDYPEERDGWIIYLTNMATSINDAFNVWLGKNQDKF